MIRKGLTESDVLEIVYKSDECFSDSSNNSISSSDNETDETAVADAVINDDSDDDDEEILHQEFIWETKDNYTGHREAFNCDSGSRLGTENVSEIVECFELFFYKETLQIVRKINRYEEQFKNMRDNLFPFCSFMRLRIPVMQNEIYIVLGPFLLTGIVQNPTVRSYFSKKSNINT
jgi:hypothetical protein